MSQVTHQSTNQVPEPSGQEVRPTVPVWLFFMLFVLLFLGMYYFDQHSGWFDAQVYAPYRSIEEVRKYQPATGGGNLDRGRAVFEQVCALCHNVDGAGKPNQAPPLAGSEWVNGSIHRLAVIPLAGLTGPITVKGQQWSLAMPAMGAAMPDEDLAAVLTYMRQSWGNKSSEVTAEQIKAIRAGLGGRSQPFTAPEIEKLPEK